MNAQKKVLLAAAAMTGLLAGASVRAAAIPVSAATSAKPATVTTTHHGVRDLDSPTTKPAGSGTGKGSQNGCPSVL